MKTVESANSVIDWTKQVLNFCRRNFCRLLFYPLRVKCLPNSPNQTSKTRTHAPSHARTQTLQLTDLTLKAPNKNCSRRHFNFLLLSFEENKASCFMWILCLEEDSHETSSYFLWKTMKYIYECRLLQSWLALKGLRRIKTKTLLKYFY